MVRPIAFLVGLGFAGILLYSLIMGAVAYVSEPPQPTAEHEFHLHPKEASFASDGPFGKFDRQQLQRGFQVYKEVCSACHSLNHVAIRSLEDIGFSGPEVKALAKTFTVPSINDKTGEATTRPGIPSDHFPSPYPNEVAGRAANNNALPPDLSLMAKARHGGGAYIYSLLSGYREPPKDLPADKRPPTGLHYNPYFANLNIAMPPPLTSEGQVTYADGTKATVDQMSKDVSAFLIWTAEPKLEARHRAGTGVVIFLLILVGLSYMAYRNVWAGKKH
jgi:ubiquinol-cytochrome c reductase cytochrome c1 subunit